MTELERLIETINKVSVEAHEGHCDVFLDHDFGLTLACSCNHADKMYAVYEALEELRRALNEH